MPTYARGQIVVDDHVGVYHCVARCVQRAFLCGVDLDPGWDRDDGGGIGTNLGPRPDPGHGRDLDQLGGAGTARTSVGRFQSTSPQSSSGWASINRIGWKRTRAACLCHRQQVRRAHAALSPAGRAGPSGHPHLAGHALRLARTVRAALQTPCRLGARRGSQVEGDPGRRVRHLLIALSADDVDLRSLLPDSWTAAHREPFMQYRHDEAETAARAGKRRRENRWARSKSGSREVRGPGQPR